MTLDELRDKKVAVLGLGENHKYLVSYFQTHDIKYQLIDQWQRVSDLDFSGYEIVFRTPGVPYTAVSIQNALRQGAVIYSQTRLFFDLCPAKIIGVTGTKGKGTTATLIHRILERVALRRAQGGKVYLAGNIGRDPFEFLDELNADNWVVMELSSFMLQDLHKSPHIAVVLKITPEHLDYHESFEEYIEAKLPIMKFQGPKDFVVLNYDSEITRNFADETHAQINWNSTRREVRPGSFVRDGKIIHSSQSGEEISIMDASEVQLLGHFNLENVTAAIAAACAAGVSDFKAIKKAVSEFKGLEPRLGAAAEVK